MKTIGNIFLCITLLFVFIVEIPISSKVDASSTMFTAELDLEEIREKMFATINEQRENNGLKKLIYDNKLEFVSQRHAEYMAIHNENKMDQYNRNPGRRLEAEGIKWWAIGENIGVMEITSDILKILEKQYWTFGYFDEEEIRNRFDPDFTNIGIGLAINEEKQELYFCVDYYTPYTNQEERKRPYAELTPVNLNGWSNEEEKIIYTCFSFRNTGNTNLTNIQIEINLSNKEDYDEIIATGTIDFQGILTPGQVVTALYQTEAGITYDLENYIHVYTINSFEISKNEYPEHYFSKIFTLSYDENNDVILDARLINTGDKTFSFHCYATYFIPEGGGFITPVGKSETVSKFSILPNTGRDIHINMGAMVDPKRKDKIRRIEITYWFVEGIKRRKDLPFLSPLPFP